MFSSVVVEVAYLRTPWIERNEMHAQFQAIMCLLSNSDRHYVSSWTILLQISCNVNTVTKVRRNNKIPVISYWPKFRMNRLIRHAMSCANNYCYGSGSASL